MLAMLFGQTFDLPDLAVVGLLVILEGVLSIDNALVLGLLAKRLPKHQQSKALTYGLIDSLVLRLIAIVLAAYLLRWKWVKILGGAYLVYVAAKHFLFERKEPERVHIGPRREIELETLNGRSLTDEEGERELAMRAPIPLRRAGSSEKATPAGVEAAAGKAYPRFWPTVFLIEMTDIAFAVDSILAAIAMIPATTVSPNPKLWVVFTGGMLGVVLMRFAAVIFIRLLERFPRFEISAYLLVMLIGIKLLLDWWFNSGEHARIAFHKPSDPAFWIFWTLMLAFFGMGFLRKKQN